MTSTIMSSLLENLFSRTMEGSLPATLDEFWQRLLDLAVDTRRPMDEAIGGGLIANRLGFAFVAGYHAALRAMRPGIGKQLCALCATEDGGAHPRAILTTLTPKDPDHFVITGNKRWSTLATKAVTLLVVTSIGTDSTGRNQLRVVAVDADLPGIRITAMPEPPFAPEIPHAEIQFDQVVVPSTSVLEGDGYETYLKPFRTLEDIYVHGALLAYLIGVGRRFRWTPSALERLSALLIATRTLAHEPPNLPETHIMLAGLLAQARQLIEETEPLWERVDDAERRRWQRDRPLLDVASKAREQRRQRAWSRLLI